MAKTSAIPVFRQYGSATARLWSALHVAVGDVRQAGAAFWRDNALGMAGMIAFYAFLSLIPLVILLLAVIGNMMTSVVATQDVRHLFQQVVPGLTQQQFLDTYWKPVRDSKVASTLLGAISLLLGTLGLHDSVDWAINRVWRSPTGRPFWIAKLRGVAVIVWVVAFALFSLWLNWLWSAVLVVSHVSGLGLAAGLGLVPAVALDTAIIAVLYKLTPTVRVSMEPAVIAAVVAGIMWECSKLAFAWWVREVSSYNRVYGTLTAIVVVMLWLWISSVVFLFGAELQCRIERRRSPLPEVQRRTVVV